MEPGTAPTTHEKRPYEECLACGISISDKGDASLLPCLHIYCSSKCRITGNNGKDVWCSKCVRKFSSDHVVKAVNLNLRFKCGNYQCQSQDLVKFYCQQCEKHFCWGCAEPHPFFQSFEGHILEPLEERKSLIDFRSKRERRESLRTLEEKLKLGMSTLKERKLTLKNASKDFETKIDDAFDSAIKILEEHREDLKQKGRKARKRKFNEIVNKVTLLEKGIGDIAYLNGVYDQVDGDMALSDTAIMNIVRASSTYSDALTQIESKMEEESFDDFVNVKPGLGVDVDVELKEKSSAILSEFRRTPINLFSVEEEKEGKEQEHVLSPSDVTSTSSNDNNARSKPLPTTAIMEMPTTLIRKGMRGPDSSTSSSRCQSTA